MGGAVHERRAVLLNLLPEGGGDWEVRYERWFVAEIHCHPSEWRRLRRNWAGHQRHHGRQLTDRGGERGERADPGKEGGQSEGEEG